MCDCVLTDSIWASLLSFCFIYQQRPKNKSWVQERRVLVPMINHQWALKMSRGGKGRWSGMFHMWYLLQFSSSLPSGQSLKPLQRKRPMMQWTPLAQAKNVGAHFDLNLAGERWKVRWLQLENTKKKTPLLASSYTKLHYSRLLYENFNETNSKTPAVTYFMFSVNESKRVKELHY